MHHWLLFYYQIVPEAQRDEGAERAVWTIIFKTFELIFKVQLIEK